MKMITFKQYLQEKLNWKRAALVGGTTIGASALAGISKGGFGLGPLGGAAIGAGIGAAYYTASGNLKKDLNHKDGKRSRTNRYKQISSR